MAVPIKANQSSRLEFERSDVLPPKTRNKKFHGPEKAKEEEEEDGNDDERPEKKRRGEAVVRWLWTRRDWEANQRWKRSPPAEAKPGRIKGDDAIPMGEENARQYRTRFPTPS